MAELERHTASVVVRSGSVLVVDNRRAVHGRQAFRSRYGCSRRPERVLRNGPRRSRQSLLIVTNRVGRLPLQPLPNRSHADSGFGR
jgi:Taurine catabolism dioxygenase TauD, TfdA family